MAYIDFKKYGINFVLDDTMTRLPLTITDNLCRVNVFGLKITFTKPDGSDVDLELVKILGKGSYGVSWSVGKSAYSELPLIVKIIPINKKLTDEQINEYAYDVIQESMTQIIIYEGTKDLDYPEISLKGPFSPKLFLIGKDNDNFYIVSERLDDNLKSVFDNYLEPSGKIIQMTMLHVSKILLTLYDLFKFNHRDLKLDNIMYNTVDSYVYVKLIDFGFSCLTYKSLVLTPMSKSVYANKLHCLSPYRDMHFFIYMLLNYSYYKNIKCSLKRLLNALITNDSISILKMPEVYNILDKENSDTNPLKALNTSCSVVYNIFLTLRFTDSEKSCSSYNSDWTQFLKILYPGNNINKSTVFYLTDEELVHVPLRVKFPNYLDEISDRTPLMDAVLNNNYTLVKTILANPDTIVSEQNNKGLTCLHLASINASLINTAETTYYEYRNGFKILFALLKKYPALADIKDYNNEKPGSVKYATTKVVQKIINSKKSWLIFRNPNTERQRRGGAKTRRRRTFWS